MATAVALAAAIVTAPPIIRSLVRLRVGQVVRDDGPASHLAKTGTPSMGGVIMLIAALAGPPAAAAAEMRRHLLEIERSLSEQRPGAKLRDVFAPYREATRPVP